MIELGAPTHSQQKKEYQKIGMKKSRNQDLNKGEVLNDLTGKENQGRPGVEYVDSKSHNKMGKNEFLKLLSHQLQHQDPFNPMKQDKLSADLARFSQLEQLTNMNSKLDNMGLHKGSEQKFYAASFLGKEIMSEGASVKVKEEGHSSPIHFQLADQSDKVLVRIFDEKNQMIKQLELSGLSKGPHQVSWDGIRSDLVPAAKGEYRVQVFAWDKNAQKVKAMTKSTGTVTSVNFNGNETVLTVDGRKKVFLRDVDSFAIDKKRDHKQGQLAKKQMIQNFQNKGKSHGQ